MLSSKYLSLPAILLAGAALFAAEKSQTFTGKVSDAMCGAQHMEAGTTGAACTRVCVGKGAKYALVVGQKAYTLDDEDKAALDKLDQLADKEAKVTGTVAGEVIRVRTVAATK